MKATIFHTLYALYPLIIGLISVFFTQILKAIYSWFKGDSFSFKRIVSSGGMPSSHSAMVASATTAIGLKQGFTSSLFCISVIFSLVVLYDAAGVRRAAGKQARVLNQMLDDIFTKGQVKYERLTEFLGHTPLEVIVGTILGVLIALIFW